MRWRNHTRMSYERTLNTRHILPNFMNSHKSSRKFAVVRSARVGRYGIPETLGAERSPVQSGSPAQPVSSGRSVRVGSRTRRVGA